MNRKEPAYPGKWETNGLTKREWLEGIAMQAIIAKTPFRISKELLPTDLEVLARITAVGAKAYAAAMSEEPNED